MTKRRNPSIVWWGGRTREYLCVSCRDTEYGYISTVDLSVNKPKGTQIQVRRTIARDIDRSSSNITSHFTVYNAIKRMSNTQG